MTLEARPFLGWFVSTRALAVKNGGKVALCSAVVLVGAIAITIVTPLTLDTPLASKRALRSSAAQSISVPTVDPVIYKPLDVATAQQDNDSIPFSAAPNPAARPYIALQGASTDRARACLTAAIYYEAASEGNGGMQAVAQVVLNRARHPAFPKTICAVVFEGSSRTTGCQFTFTCDGSMMKVPEAAAWVRANQIADTALKGGVYKPVGLATHYHTRFVVPYWRDGLDKIVAVGAHIFYRWPGSWGGPRVQVQIGETDEPVIPALAGLAAAHGPLPLQTNSEETVPVPGSPKVPPLDDHGPLLRTLDAAAGPDSFLPFARTACAGRTLCEFMGWTDTYSVPTDGHVTSRARDTMSFSFHQDISRKTERALWNCRQFKDRGIRNCIQPPLLIDLQQNGTMANK